MNISAKEVVISFAATEKGRNDMPRYYESELLIDFVKQNTPHINGETTMECVERAIQKAPTADVVPKSEIVNILDGLMKEAREIANLYEKSANETSDYDYARIEYRGCQMGALLVLFKIAELKKKYTEIENG